MTYLRIVIPLTLLAEHDPGFREGMLFGILLEGSMLRMILIRPAAPVSTLRTDLVAWIERSWVGRTFYLH